MEEKETTGNQLNKNQIGKTGKAGKIGRSIIFFLLSVVLLYFSFRGVKWGDFTDGLMSCNYAWILVSMAVGVIGFIVRALRWRLLMLPLNGKVSRMEAYNGVTVAYLTNFVFPRAGELARCGVIAQTGKISFEGTLGTVVLERTFDLFCLLFWVLFLLVFKWQQFGKFIEETLLEPLFTKIEDNIVYGVVAVVVLLAIVIIPVLLRRKLSRFKIFNKLSGVAKGLVKGFLSAFKMKRKWLFLLYTALLWGTYWLTRLTTIYAFPQVHDLTAIDALFLMIVGGLGWAVPVQGGIGAYHLVISMALLGVYGIARQTGIIFATISHESQALVMIICGAVSLVIINAAIKKLKRKDNRT